MRYAQIRKTDISNGTGIRTSLFVQGCTRKCKGCFNPETWDFEGGHEWNEQAEEEFLTLTAGEHIAGATILGGEPMEPENRRPVRELLRKLKERCPEKISGCILLICLKRSWSLILRYFNIWMF